MNNLTNEERARIFAMYMPCKAIVDNTDSDLIGLDFCIINSCIIHNYNDSGERQIFAPTDVKILLTPLSKITDEHAIEVAHIWKPDYEWKVVEREGYFLMVECADYIMWFDFTDNSFVFEEKYTGEENNTINIFYIFIEAHGCEKEITSCESIVEIIDRLRKLGYALPYKGQSLFDLGIAIDKTTL